MNAPWERGEIGPPLAIASALYGAAIRARRLAYDAGLAETVKLSRPVISVGNLAVGGTGKTPFTILLARRLEARGARVAVLSRGYAAHPGPDPVLVASGGTLLARPDVGGDEPILIGAKTRAMVVVCPDRARAGRLAIERGADVLILDDGFQHRRLARDLDVVLLDATDPFGNGRLLPAGPLREPREALSRADLVVYTGAASPFADPAVRAVTRPTAIRAPDGTRADPSTLAGKRVALVAAIARPERFAATVTALGATITRRTFLRDHAPIPRRAFEDGDLVLTTEKDAARAGPIPAHVLETELVIERGDADLEAALAKVLP